MVLGSNFDRKSTINHSKNVVTPKFQSKNKPLLLEESKGEEDYDP